ncbi:hypothetical protein OF83DRAFT_1145712 [Amylostereum chailletii]|nr:hypothetical protein OF83DRAFT_1145712 [Amylostereum chailletii]
MAPGDSRQEGHRNRRSNPQFRAPLLQETRLQKRHEDIFPRNQEVSARAMAKLAGFNSVESLPMVQPSSPSPSNTGRNDGTPPADPAAKTAAADSPSSELPPAHDTEVEASDIETGGIPMEILTNNSPEELIQAFAEMMPNITPLRIETNLTPDELPIRLADIPEDNDIDGEFQREISSQISTSNKVDDNTTVPTSLTAEVLPAESQVPVGTSPAIEEGLY